MSEIRDLIYEAKAEGKGNRIVQMIGKALGIKTWQAPPDVYIIHEWECAAVKIGDEVVGFLVMNWEECDVKFILCKE